MGRTYDKMRKWRQDLASDGAIVPEEIYGRALLESSNLDSNMKVQLERIARTASADGKNISGEKLEETLLRFKNSEDDK